MADPAFVPQLEPKYPAAEKGVTSKTMPRSSRKGRPPKAQTQSPIATLTPKIRKSKEKTHPSPRDRDVTPPIRSLDELRAAGLVEDEQKLQGLMKSMYT
jgi:hypothetical protein